jgi:hypothetical protein
LRFKNLYIFSVLLISAGISIGLLSTSSLLAQSDHEEGQRIDFFIDKKMFQAGVQPMVASEDAVFHRRIYLDVVGMIPSAKNTEAFIKNKPLDKKSKLIDALLNSPSYTDHWTNIWFTFLIGRNPDRSKTNHGKLRAWLLESVSKNRPYDRWVSDLLTAKGQNDEHGATNFLIHHDLEPLAIAGSVSKLFLGLPLECAQCHDHPTEEWTQKDYYGMAAFFSQVIPEEPTRNMRAKFQKMKEANEITGPMPVNIIDQERRKFIINGVKGEEIISPRFIDGRRPKAGDWALRHAFVDLMISPTSPYFSKNIVNRIWAHFFGRGLVEPLDGLIDSNPATHPELLNWLAGSFIAHKYDLKYLIRTITNSKAYQRASLPLNEAENNDLYAHSIIRPLTPDQTVSSILQATGLEGINSRLNRDEKTTIKNRMISQFSFAFNNDEREEMDRFYGTIPQALLMMNGRLTNWGSLAMNGNNLGKILSENTTHRERIYWIYMAVLSRPPTPDEYIYTDNLRPSRRSRKAREVYEDLFWALINSTEFSVNY